jgi:hypothetical protein
MSQLSNNSPASPSENAGSNKSKEKIPRHLKSKHRKINKQHPEFELTYDMMLGIRTVVGKTEAQPHEKLTDSDFKQTIKLKFPGRGGMTTPAHQMRDFKFKDYSPEVFRLIREKFDINPADYLMCVCGNFQYLEFVSNSKSGQFFFYTHDRRYMIKTVSQAECKFLREILPSYYAHIAANPQTLLTRFYGMHRVKPHKKKETHFLIMGSVFYTTKYIHTVFDLKGSKQGRSATEAEKKSSTCVYKDLDFLEKNITLRIGNQRAEILNRQIAKDVEFLRNLNIMDYSLLLGIHFRNRANNKVSAADYEGTVKSTNGTLNYANSTVTLDQIGNSKAQTKNINDNHTTEAESRSNNTNGQELKLDDTVTPDDIQLNVNVKPLVTAVPDDNAVDYNRINSASVVTFHNSPEATSPINNSIVQNNTTISPATITTATSLNNSNTTNTTTENITESDPPAAETSPIRSHLRINTGETDTERMNGTSKDSPHSVAEEDELGSLPVGKHAESDEKTHDGLVQVLKSPHSNRQSRAFTSIDASTHEKLMQQYHSMAGMTKRQSQYGLPKQWNITSKPSDIAFNAPEFEPIPILDSPRKKEVQLLSDPETKEKVETNAAATVEAKVDVRPDHLVSADCQLIYENGGVAGLTADGQLSNEIYFMGIIDILTLYSLKKRAETLAKSFKYDKNDISSVSPTMYGQRFKKFLALAFQ